MAVVRQLLKLGYDGELFTLAGRLVIIMADFLSILTEG